MTGAELRQDLRLVADHIPAKARVLDLGCGDGALMAFLAESKGASYNIKAGLDEAIRKRYRDFMEKLALIFESGIQKKRFRDIAAPYHLAVALDSVVDAFLLLWLEAPERHPYPEDPDIILDIFFKGLTIN